MTHDARTLRQVAELHAGSIDQGFLSSLGIPFLTVLYRAIDRSPCSVLLVERDSTGVIGFVSGGSGMGPIYRQMLRSFPALFLALAPIFLQPRKISGILDILRHGAKRDGRGDLPEWELFSIAVNQSARGSGAAGHLYQSLCAHARAQGVPAFRIVVGDSLGRAQRFYIRLGAKPVGTVRLHGDATSTVFVQRLSDTMVARNNSG